jgi:hypothetical protein
MAWRACNKPLEAALAFGRADFAAARNSPCGAAARNDHALPPGILKASVPDHQAGLPLRVLDSIVAHTLRTSALCNRKVNPRHRHQSKSDAVIGL